MLYYQMDIIKEISRFKRVRLIARNSPAEQGALLIEPDRCFFILDTDYFQNIEVYSDG